MIEPICEAVPPEHQPPTLEQIDKLGDDIAELAAQLTAATYRLLVMVREFDECGGWGSSRSCAHWLNWRIGLGLGAAREKVRTARALGNLPVTSEAMRKGRLSYSKVRALTRIATPENEEELVLMAVDMTAANVERIVRAYRRVNRLAEAELADKRYESRTLSYYNDQDGMLVVRGRLDPEQGEALRKAIDHAEQVLFRRKNADTLPGQVARDVVEDTTFGQRQADALVLLVETALEAGLDAPTSRQRAEVVVHVDSEVLADPDADGQSCLESGDHVPAGTSRRLSCDCSTVTMLHDGNGNTLDVGRKTRVISPAMRRALDHRDGKTCQFPGCGVQHCEAHHIHHWAAGGETNLDNLVLTCRFHHRALHEGGFRVERRGGCLEYRDPEGRLIEDAPALPEVHGDGVSTLREQHSADGLDIDSRTNLPMWDGSPMELDLVIDWLTFDDVQSVPAGTSEGTQRGVGRTS